MLWVTASLSFSAWRLRAVRPEVEFGCLWAAFSLLAGAEQQLWEKRIKCSVYAATVSSLALAVAHLC